MTENKYKIVSSNVEEGIYTQIRKDGKNAFTLKEAMKYVEEHEQSARETNTELEIEPLPNCLYVEDETTKTFLTNLYGIDFDKRADYVIKEHPHLNIKWQTGPEFYHDGFECNIVEDTNTVALLYHDKHQINEVGCDKEIKFMDLDEFLASNPNAKTIETIGDFVKKHTGDDKHKVYLFKYCKDYLNEEDTELFFTLVACTTGCRISAEIDEDGDVNVNDDNGKCYASYSNDFPVTAVYIDLLSKMNMTVRQCMKSLREQYAKDKELRVYGFYPAIYNSLREYAKFFGIQIKDGWDEDIKVPYIDIIGINE